MPDLPTITVSQAHADRILAAFKARFNTTTTAETAQAYRAELSRFVRKVVLDYEAEKFLGDQESGLQSHLDAVALELPDELPFPDTV